MYVCAEFRPLGPEEINIRRRALRDAVICIGWLKLVSIFCYAALFTLTFMYSKGKISNALQVMILALIPAQIINGVLLFMGALESKTLALNLALWLILFIAAYNTILGMMGSIYFIRIGFVPMHFILSLIFGILTLSIFTVLCHDVIVIYTLRTLIEPMPTTNIDQGSMNANDENIHQK